MRANRTNRSHRSIFMQPTKQNSLPSQPAQKGQGAKGPTPIDPRDFKHVSGGLPKGGWGSPQAL
jgi:hypothetical protein